LSTPEWFTLAHITTEPSSASALIGLRENASPLHVPPSTAPKKPSTLRQLPGLPANQAAENVVGVGL
jgi:hypothetical protein